MKREYMYLIRKNVVLNDGFLSVDGVTFIPRSNINIQTAKDTDPNKVILPDLQKTIELVLEAKNTNFDPKYQWVHEELAFPPSLKELTRRYLRATYDLDRGITVEVTATGEKVLLTFNPRPWDGIPKPGMPYREVSLANREGIFLITQNLATIVGWDDLVNKIIGDVAANGIVQAIETVNNEIKTLQDKDTQIEEDYIKRTNDQTAPVLKGFTLWDPIAAAAGAPNEYKVAAHRTIRGAIEQEAVRVDNVLLPLRANFNATKNILDAFIAAAANNTRVGLGEKFIDDEIMTKDGTINDGSGDIDVKLPDGNTQSIQNTRKIDFKILAVAGTPGAGSPELIRQISNYVWNENTKHTFEWEIENPEQSVIEPVIRDYQIIELNDWAGADKYADIWTATGAPARPTNPATPLTNTQREFFEKHIATSLVIHGSGDNKGRETAQFRIVFYRRTPRTGVNAGDIADAIFKIKAVGDTTLHTFPTFKIREWVTKADIPLGTFLQVQDLQALKAELEIKLGDKQDWDIEDPRNPGQRIDLEVLIGLINEHIKNVEEEGLDNADEISKLDYIKEDASRAEGDYTIHVDNFGEHSLKELFDVGQTQVLELGNTAITLAELLQQQITDGNNGLTPNSLIAQKQLGEELKPINDKIATFTNINVAGWDVAGNSNSNVVLGNLNGQTLISQQLVEHLIPAKDAWLNTDLSGKNNNNPAPAPVVGGEVLRVATLGAGLEIQTLDDLKADLGITGGSVPLGGNPADVLTWMPVGSATQFDWQPVPEQVPTIVGANPGDVLTIDNTGAAPIKVWQAPASGLPAGGTAGQVITRDAGLAAVWQDVPKELPDPTNKNRHTLVVNDTGTYELESGILPVLDHATQSNIGKVVSVINPGANPGIFLEEYGLKTISEILLEGIPPAAKQDGYHLVINTAGGTSISAQEMMSPFTDFDTNANLALATPGQIAVVRTRQTFDPLNPTENAIVFEDNAGGGMPANGALNSEMKFQNYNTGSTSHTVDGNTLDGSGATPEVQAEHRGITQSFFNFYHTEVRDQVNRLVGEEASFVRRNELTTSVVENVGAGDWIRATANTTGVINVAGVDFPILANDVYVLFNPAIDTFPTAKFTQGKAADIISTNAAGAEFSLKALFTVTTGTANTIPINNNFHVGTLILGVNGAIIRGLAQQQATTFAADYTARRVEQTGVAVTGANNNAGFVTAARTYLGFNVDTAPTLPAGFTNLQAVAEAARTASTTNVAGLATVNAKAVIYGDNTIHSITDMLASTTTPPLAANRVIASQGYVDAKVAAGGGGAGNNLPGGATDGQILEYALGRPGVGDGAVWRNAPRELLAPIGTSGQVLRIRDAAAGGQEWYVGNVPSSLPTTTGITEESSLVTDAVGALSWVQRPKDFFKTGQQVRDVNIVSATFRQEIRLNTHGTAPTFPAQIDYDLSAFGQFDLTTFPKTIDFEGNPTGPAGQGKGNVTVTALNVQSNSSILGVGPDSIKVTILNDHTIRVFIGGPAAAYVYNNVSMFFDLMGAGKNVVDRSLLEKTRNDLEAADSALDVRLKRQESQGKFAGQYATEAAAYPLLRTLWASPITVKAGDFIYIPKPGTPGTYLIQMITTTIPDFGGGNVFPAALVYQNVGEAVDPIFTTNKVDTSVYTTYTTNNDKRLNGLDLSAKKQGLYLLEIGAGGVTTTLREVKINTKTYVYDDGTQETLKHIVEV